MVSKGDFEVSPGLRHAWIKQQRSAAQLKSEYPLEPRPIHPPSGTGIPGPSTAPNMRRLRVNVGTDNVWFHLVTMNRGTRASVIYRVQESKQFAGLIPVAEHRKRQH